MVSISIVSYPPESTKELGKRFLALPPMPEFITVVGPYTTSETGDGIQAYTIYKYDKSRAAEALEAITNVHLAFYGVPGYTFAIKLASSAATSLKMLGLE
jgi:hypothetical protein